MRDLVVLLVFAIAMTACSVFSVSAQSSMSEAEIDVAMRAIGHQVLMAHGDTTSRINPIKHDGSTYIIQFETKFVFQTSKLIKAVDQVVTQNGVASEYLVEMQHCETKEIIHSYKVTGYVDLTAIACSERTQPEACYNLRFTIFDNEQALSPLTTVHQASMSKGVFWTMSVILTLSLLFYAYQKRSDKTVDPNVIFIGSYQFNPHKMLLSNADQTVALTSKESDLLTLLYGSVNTTISRDDILHDVWGDKGDYVGRTLDVFISKLRRKLEEDPSIKITNIRGVGYRLVV